jgi:hypothetical protein
LVHVFTAAFDVEVESFRQSLHEGGVGSRRSSTQGVIEMHHNQASIAELVENVEQHHGVQPSRHADQIASARGVGLKKLRDALDHGWGKGIKHPA